VTESGTPVGTADDRGGLLESATEPADSAGSDSQSDAETPAPGRATVDVIDNDFDPSPLRISVGGLVTWTNVGGLPHTVTSDGFDSGIMSPGDGFEWRFDTAGTFDYLCELHPGMAGRIIVEAAAEIDPAIASTSNSGSVSRGSSPGNSVAFAVFMAGGLAVAGVGMAVGVGRFAKAVDNGTLR
jgi:plastocyanin